VNTGLPVAQARLALSQLVQTEAVTLATRQVFLLCTVIFFVAACLIWLAPKPGARKGRQARTPFDKLRANGSFRKFREIRSG
jgi:hypothetical protein